jgi:hypothetical protein
MQTLSTPTDQVSPSTQIWREKHEIEEARRHEMREAMEEYDRTVYHPAMNSLRERCAAIGHKRGNFHDNGIGWTWFYCNQCGDRMEIEGPDRAAS